MMLQGWNMLSIARMGGHSQLKTQLHYHRHLDYFVQSWVYNLSQRQKMERINRSMPESVFSNNEIISRSKIFSPEDFDNKYEVDYGYCTYSPIKCEIGDCRFCPYFFFYPRESEEQALNWLMDCSSVLDQRIREQLALLKQIGLNMQYDLQLLEHQKTGQERLSAVASELNKLMHQKAMVDSHLEE